MKKIIRFLALKILDFFDFFYKLKFLKFLKKNRYNKFDIFFDIGAHKGESINLFTKNFDIKTIYSFEASPINFRELEKKTKKLLNYINKTKVVIENLAIGNENKNISLNQSEESSSSTIKEINQDSNYFKKKQKLLKTKNNFFKKITIKMISLKDYIDTNDISYIDFLKIDTEGYEYEILLGLKDKFSIVKMIMFEHHYDDMIRKNYKFSDINNLLINNNFNQIYKSRMPFRKTFEYIYLKQK